MKMKNRLKPGAFKWIVGLIILVITLFLISKLNVGSEGLQFNDGESLEQFLIVNHWIDSTELVPDNYVEILRYFFSDIKEARFDFGHGMYRQLRVRRYDESQLFFLERHSFTADMIPNSFYSKINKTFVYLFDNGNALFNFHGITTIIKVPEVYDIYQEVSNFLAEFLDNIKLAEEIRNIRY